MTLQHPDHAPYRHLTKRQRVDKAVHTLLGLLRGISIDDRINASEIAEIQNWCDEYRDLVDKAPFNELIPKVDQILSDRVVDPDEQDELLWVCTNLSAEGDFYDEITHDIQTLQGILHGIMADDHASTEEIQKLRDWVNNNSHMKGSYPYDELDSLLIAVLADGKIDEEEQKQLKAFFDDFIEYSFAKKARVESQRIRGGLPKQFTLPGICATCPEITFDGRTFTFTGSSLRGARTELAEHVDRLKGKFSRNLTEKTDFLVVGSAGNPCWAFSCYGRKVEQAVNYRKKGHPIIIVHESDFWDAVEDHGG